MGYCLLQRFGVGLQCTFWYIIDAPFDGEPNASGMCLESTAFDQKSRAQTLLDDDDDGAPVEANLTHLA